MHIQEDLNLQRGLLLLERSNVDDLVRMWRIFGSYNFGAPAIETRPGWWNV